MKFWKKKIETGLLQILRVKNQEEEKNRIKMWKRIEDRDPRRKKKLKNPHEVSFYIV